MFTFVTCGNPTKNPTKQQKKVNNVFFGLRKPGNASTKPLIIVSIMANYKKNKKNKRRRKKINLSNRC
jgi:hypothetical protein